MLVVDYFQRLHRKPLINLSQKGVPCFGSFSTLSLSVALVYSVELQSGFLLIHLQTVALPPVEVPGAASLPPGWWGFLLWEVCPHSNVFFPSIVPLSETQNKNCWKRCRFCINIFNSHFQKSDLNTRLIIIIPAQELYALHI